MDAALDATNVARVAHYIRNCTRQAHTGRNTGAVGDSSGGGDVERRGGGGDNSSKRQRRSDAAAGGGVGVGVGVDDDAAAAGVGGGGGGALESFQSIVISLKDIFYEKVGTGCVCARM